MANHNSYNRGAIATSINAVAATGAVIGDDFVFQYVNGYLPSVYTWEILIGGTGSFTSFTVLFEISLDGSNWYSADSQTAAGIFSVSSKPSLYARCHISAAVVASGNPTITARFVATR